MRNIYPLNSRFTLPFAFVLAVSLLVVSLMFMLPGGPLHAQTSDDTIEYAENGTGAAATFTAIDPEQTAIASWSLAGTDADVFDIAGGVLTFKESPDYETAADDGMDNMYSVTVQAMDSTNKMGTKEVMVEVTNEEEPGTVALSALRPQSATILSAELTDPDGSISGTTWQWAKASSRNGTYGNIEDATSMTYTPGDADIGSYLRATASYVDGEGSDKSAMAMSVNTVQAVRGTNNTPVFPDQDPDMDGDQSDDATREVRENTPAGMAIGDPVAATDANGDVLTYTLTGTDAESFDINWATGQIMTKAALDEETKSTYTVTVRATDPSGMPGASTAQTANSDEIMVTIDVTDVNEAPVVTGDATVTFNEVAGDITDALENYTAPDADVGDNSVTWSVSGADSGKFTITGGELEFKAKPDFENPGDANGDNTYEVTVVAADSNGNRGTMDVKVMVANENEDGVVALSRTQPRVGVPVKATLTDPDGSISGLRWQWYDGNFNDNDLTQNAIEDATSDTYTPVTDDVGDTLTAVASYTDGEAAMQIAMTPAPNMVEVDTRNSPPAFVDQDTDTDGIQNESATREVDENTEADASDDAAETDTETGDNVGSPVAATDPDPNTDPLIYTLSGPDAGLFRVRDNGQIEVAAGTELNYEARVTYTVVLTAEDSFGASDSIVVTIMVTDLDEVPAIMVGGLGITGQRNVSYAENGAGAVETYTAVGPDAASARWSLEGPDAGDFTFSGGVLAFRSSPDYEMPADADTNNIYMVTLKANDGTYMATVNVTIRVTDVDETTPGDSLLERYDDDRSGRIDRNEVIAAIDDYLFGVGDEKLTRPQVIEVIDLYLFGG